MKLAFPLSSIGQEGAKRANGGKCCDGGLKQEGEGGLALVRNEDVKINEASAGSDARLIL